MSQTSRIVFAIVQMVKKFQNCQQISKLSKVVKIVNNKKIEKFVKIPKIVKNGQKMSYWEDRQAYTSGSIWVPYQAIWGIWSGPVVFDQYGWMDGLDISDHLDY